MLKNIFRKLFPATAILLCLTACSSYVPYYDRIDAVIEMSEEMTELYNENIISVGEKISRKNVSDYCSKESKIYSYMNSDQEFQDYKIVMIDDDKALTITNTIFGSAEGFVVNLGTDSIGNTYEVPEQLGFDDNTIDLVKTDQYTNVYTFSAGV